MLFIDKGSMNISYLHGIQINVSVLIKEVVIFPDNYILFYYFLLLFCVSEFIIGAFSSALGFVVCSSWGKCL